LTDIDLKIAGAKGIMALGLLFYYWLNLHDARKMETTLHIWAYRKKIMLKQKIVIKFVTDEEYLSDYYPLAEVVMVFPGVTLLRFKDGKYAVMWKVYTKNYDPSIVDELELHVKTFLDGLPDLLVFNSIWYKVTAQNKKAKQVIEDGANHPLHTKASDMLVQAYMAHVTTDTTPQNIVKHLYFQELGYCRSIEEAISQFDSIVPGLERILKNSFHNIERLVVPADIFAIFRELWEDEEVEEWQMKQN
jgi:hypothetical protein